MGAEVNGEGVPLSKAQLRRRHLLGLLLVVVVVIIWVSSSVLIQIIFQDSDFDKPFFLTYLSTSLFSVYLFGFGIRWKQWTANVGFPSKKYTTLVDQKDTLEETSTLSETIAPLKPSASTNSLVEHQLSSSTISPSGYTTMSVYEIFKLSAIFCPIWFCANYTYNLGLSMTSVSSNTILSTLSGFFALALSRVMGVDTFNIWKLIAAAVTLGGVVMVSLADTEGGGKESILGDVYTVVGAALYAFYCTLLKKRIVHEDRLIMPMFFGFMGIINFLTLWPFLLTWSALKFEPLEMPSGRVWGFLILNGLIGTVLSDILEAFSIILTTPLINTLGLSLTIPMAMVSDIIRKAKSFSPVYYIGSLLVFVGFVLVNLSSGTFEERFADWRKRTWDKCTSKFGRKMEQSE